MAAVPVEIAVACGVLVNANGEVLIAQRPEGKIAAGMWEFPGGKIEAGESAKDALLRELHEELGVDVEAAQPLIRVRHAYSDRVVLLDTWKVTVWRGEPHGREQQDFRWVAPEHLNDWPLLAADAPIVDALRLPAHYVFTPPDITERELIEQLPGLPGGALLRLRLPSLDDSRYRAIAAQVIDAARTTALRVVLDRDPDWVEALGAWGWHASARTVASLSATGRPLPEWRLASAHSHEELRCAADAGYVAAVLGTVQPSASHPGVAGIGWSGFETRARGLNLPVYGIGGLTAADLPQAYAAYAQGIAGISGYWREHQVTR